jgi:NAD(P)-dependent dehydrogenase (short-subunit alcohol dehydrogenase family)
MARTRVALDDLRQEIESGGGDFLPVVADIADVDEIPDLVGRVSDWKGSIDSLVNSAGITNRSSALDITPEEWDRLFDVNLRGAFFLTREVGRRMLDGNGGSVVSIASLSGVVSDGAQAAYSAAKAAMIQMSQVLADQWAPKVRLNCISPGWVATDMTADFLGKEENLDMIYEQTPMRRVARPEEMVGPALYLVSDMSSYMTGQNLVIDGGWTT